MISKKEATNIIKIASTYTAVVLGAGFASGQELMQFFVSYKEKGFLGIVLSTLIFCFIAYASLSICYYKKIKGYGDFVAFLMGKRLSELFEVVIAFFLFILFSTMLSAGGAIFKESFGLSSTLGIILLGGICLFIFLFDFSLIVSLNTIFSPILIAGGVFIGFYSFFNNKSPVFLQLDSALLKNWFFSAILYSSYNIITALTVVTDMSNYLTSKKIVAFASIAGGVSIGLIALSFSLPLFMSYDSVKAFEIPMMKIVDSLGNGIKYLYLAVLLCAILSTALANGFSFLKWLTPKVNMKPLKLKLIIIAAAIFSAHFGFSNFVAMAYSFFGYVGLIEIGLIVLLFVRLVL